MTEPRFKGLTRPDESLHFPNVTQDIVALGDLSVGRFVHGPGWRWSTHIKPLVGGEFCQARHLGIVLSGRIGIELKDGTKFELGPLDVFDIPPGHDAHTIGDEPCITIEWAGLHAFMGTRVGSNRVLATLLFTDLVNSTATASRMGDRAWGSLLSTHFAAARTELERHRGREVKTAGDGLLATFDGPAAALNCATAIVRAAQRDDLHIRVGVHVGEVEIVGKDVRGVAVHAAARIMAEAKADEILVSDITRSLAASSGFAFEARGAHPLKGLPDEWPLFALVAA